MLSLELKPHTYLTSNCVALHKNMVLYAYAQGGEFLVQQCCLKTPAGYSGSQNIPCNTRDF